MRRRRASESAGPEPVTHPVFLFFSPAAWTVWHMTRDQPLRTSAQPGDLPRSQWRKHVPKVVVDERRVIVSVPHGNHEGDYIQFIWVTSLDGSIIGVSQLSLNDWPTMTVIVPKGVTHIRAYAACSRHGMWGLVDAIDMEATGLDVQVPSPPASPHATASSQAASSPSRWAKRAPQRISDDEESTPFHSPLGSPLRGQSPFGSPSKRSPRVSQNY
jgi:desulfoferrodoxin (superoxide reductase-like protein)